MFQFIQEKKEKKQILPIILFTEISPGWYQKLPTLQVSNLKL